MTDAEYHAAAGLARDDAQWTPGAWTPARCALYRVLDSVTKDRLEAWIWAEHTRGKRHEGQLPELYAMKEAA